MIQKKNKDDDAKFFDDFTDAIARSRAKWDEGVRVAVGALLG
jgi:hypothetical protein